MKTNLAVKISEMLEKPETTNVLIMLCKNTDISFHPKLKQFILDHAEMIFFNKNVVEIENLCKNIFKQTTKIAIDDLIIENLLKTCELEWIFFIVQNMPLRREMLRLIFEMVLYGDFFRDEYKFKVLESILKKYFYLDKIVDKIYNATQNHLLKGKIGGNEILNVLNMTELEIFCKGLIGRNETTFDDNGYVLIHELWEEIILYEIEDEKAAEIGNLLIQIFDLTGDFMHHKIKTNKTFVKKIAEKNEKLKKITKHL
ncbi:hypothetical protein NUSPORA_00797 [Nucleospora cyclopteri]